MGFDVEFPAIRAAADRLRIGDAETRHLGTLVKDTLDDAGDVAGDGPLAAALFGLSDSMQEQCDNAAKEIAELWQAIGESEEDYYSADRDAASGIAAVRFGGHDGFS